VGVKQLQVYAGVGGHEASEEAQIMFEFQL
jgi:hypothetical protein